MRKKITILTAAVATALALALPASAGGPPAGAGDGGQPEGIACQLAGIDVLKGAGLIDDVARDGLDTNLGTFSLTEVLALHRTMPELFQTGTPVTVDGIGTPTWCD
ncbi:MAG: hypothetical protein WB239_06210 [Acidimicrobiia bacterium]